MTIPIIEEGDTWKEIGLHEGCHFCKTKTTTWHENTNNPVCASCAKKHKVAELPDYGQTIRKNKRKRKKQ